MNEYHKIHTVFKRDLKNNSKTLLNGVWALPEFEYLAKNTWGFTEKVDGMNIRVMLRDGKISFGGKTDNAQIPPKLMTRLMEMFYGADFLYGMEMGKRMGEIFGGDACLYGEGYGAKIQKGGGNYREDQSFVMYDIKVGDLWLKREDVEDVAMKLGLSVVPFIGHGTLYDAVAMAFFGFDSKWGKFKAEGIVARPQIELKTRNGSRIIAKIKHKDF